mmetsp:Transcript_6608/g.26895  ORF Transcript_6608/g.26895 Transcript_6608/m.26895 type:complete len:214 (-) Transcript_6608:314-955(-)
MVRPRRPVLLAVHAVPLQLPRPLHLGVESLEIPNERLGADDLGVTHRYLHAPRRARPLLAQHVLLVSPDDYLHVHAPGVRVLDQAALQRQRLGPGVPRSLGVHHKAGKVRERLEVSVEGVVELFVRAGFASLEREHGSDPHGGQHERGEHVRHRESAQDEGSALGEVHVDEEIRPRPVVGQVDARAVLVQRASTHELEPTAHDGLGHELRPHV